MRAIRLQELRRTTRDQALKQSPRILGIHFSFKGVHELVAGRQRTPGVIVAPHILEFLVTGKLEGNMILGSRSHVPDSLGKKMEMVRFRRLLAQACQCQCWAAVGRIDPQARLVLTLRLLQTPVEGKFHTPLVMKFRIVNARGARSIQCRQLLRMLPEHPAQRSNANQHGAIFRMRQERMRKTGTRRYVFTQQQ